ncbi:hypothetical protein NL676_020160 [Syzygium grande]|nr:hypothetical protein NL676_020160 [Syzygium grande]
MVKELVQTNGEGLLEYPMPQVIKEDKSAWRTDEEFCRKMLAGVNTFLIRRLAEFPPASKLDPKIHGKQSSSIREELIQKQLNGLTVEQDDGTLKPLAIELSLPHPEGDGFGAISKVYPPADQGINCSIWQLAKAHVAVDPGHHQLVSHRLNTHAVIEPFVIATNRQLSVLHPIYKLLHPHFRDTMNTNAFTRQILINASGILESTGFPGNVLHGDESSVRPGKQSSVRLDRHNRAHASKFARPDCYHIAQWLRRGLSRRLRAQARDTKSSNLGDLPGSHDLKQTYVELMRPQTSQI